MTDAVDALAATIHQYCCCLTVKVHGDTLSATLTNPDQFLPDPDHTVADRFRATQALQALRAQHGYTLTPATPTQPAGLPHGTLRIVSEPHPLPDLS